MILREKDTFCNQTSAYVIILTPMTEREIKSRRSHKIKTASGKTHNFTARRVSLNKLAARKINFNKLQTSLEKEKSLLDASDIPIN